MKINKWTLGLAAVGLVSLASVARAEEAKSVPMMTALSATTISGYVDTSAVWNPGTGNANPAPYSFNAGKQDGFNVNAVDVAIEKALEEGQYSSGYRLELMYGPDNVAAAGAAPIRQAYVSMRAPVGNGLDLKVGRFDGILGYESTDSYKNPNASRSYGYTMLPTENTGVLADYKVNAMIDIVAGVANTDQAVGGINARSGRVESHKMYMGALTLTLPESAGAMAGSTIYAGASSGFGTVANNEVDVYAGLTLSTPVKALKVGFAYTEVHNFAPGGVDFGYVNSYTAYASFQASDKVSLHLRGEYARGAGLGLNAPVATGLHKVLAVTGTLQYDLWQNVISRLEVRWDHDASGGQSFGGTVAGAPTKSNDISVAANIVYKF